MTDFYFIRHGQTTANQQGIKQGQINGQNTYLNALGKQQARELRESFDFTIADRFIVSPLIRARQTADILNVELQRPVLVDDRLKEISYGEWDGQNNAALMQQFPQAFNQELKDVQPNYVKFAPQGEEFATVVKRVGEFLKETSEKFPKEKIVVITHGFTIKAAILNVLNLADPMVIPEPDNLRRTLIRINHRHAYLYYYNR